MKIIFYTGKGGVGKSTMSAASAWQLSQSHKVLIVSLDPAHNLGDIFGTRLNDRKTSFSKNLFLKEIDLQKLSREYLQREIKVLTGTYRYLQTINLDNYFSVLKYSPGIEEYALLTSIEETIRSENTFDYIIFDTPPTGLTLRFLALPRVTITWIERLIQIRRTILEKRFTIHRIRGTLDKKETVLDYREEDDEAIKRLKALDKNYQELNAILQGRNSSVVLVYNPDVLSLRESERLIEGLQELGLPLRLLINNKVTDENTTMADRIDDVIGKKVQGGVPIQRVNLSSSLLDGAKNTLYDVPENIISLFL